MIDVVFHVFRASLLFGLIVKVNETYFGNARVNECPRCSRGGVDKGEASGIKGTSVMVVQGYREELLMRSPANGDASCGRVATFNLGYRKDAFLEPSLVATTTHFPNKPTIIIPTLNLTSLALLPCPPTTLNSHPTSPLVLLALIPAVILLVLELLIVALMWSQRVDRLLPWPRVAT